MNIGIVTTWFERGAAYVSKQYEKLLEPNHQVFIFARGGEYQAENDPVWNKPNVFWSSKIKPNIISGFDLIEFQKWIADNNIETVFFNEQRWWAPVILCKKLGIKTGAYIDYYTEITVSFFNIYDFLICNTQRHYSVFKQHNQAFYIPWGTDIDLFKPHRLSIKSNGNVEFFHSAGMSPSRKGTDLLIKAFNQLKSDKASLIIHSQINLQQSLPKFKIIINKLIEQKKLKIIEETVSAPGLYHLGDVYVYPSRLEGIGLSIAEALSSGLPVIVPGCGPMNEFIGNSPSQEVKIDKLYSRYDGYYWPQNEVNIDDLAEKMNDFISVKEHLPEFKKKTREYALEHLDWSSNKIDVENIFIKSKRQSIPNNLSVIQQFDNSHAGVDLLDLYENNLKKYKKIVSRKSRPNFMLRVKNKMKQLTN